ncbi:MAG TPA: hypothetical protein VHW26_10780, partial [Solirubrobacteraceae bacterium]|nr:hypothetical protein [Solirubrobacteraceae bacterium]
AFAVSLWWLASTGLQSVQLPAPPAVWNALRTDLSSIPGLSYVSYQSQSEGPLNPLLWTVSNVLICCAIGAVIGYAVGMALAISRRTRDILGPPLFVLGTTPTLVLLPFILIWFGTSRLAQGSLVIIFTALTVAAFTDQSARLIGQGYSASPLPSSRTCGSSDALYGLIPLTPASRYRPSSPA